MSMDSAILHPGGPDRQMSIYGGKDPRQLPAYTFADAGRLLTVNPSTIRNWAKGHGDFRRVLTIPGDLPANAVSFFNLIEIFVLDELRRRHSFSLQQLRPSIAYMREAFPRATHPLAEVDLFVSNKRAVRPVRRIGACEHLPWRPIGPRPPSTPS